MGSNKQYRRNAKNRRFHMESLENRQMFSTVGWDGAACGTFDDTNTAYVSNAAVGANSSQSLASLGDDHGNNFNNATQFNLSSVGNAIRTGNIEQSGDQDMYRFVATRTGRMTISLSASSGSSLDTYLYVYDGNQNLIASDDDSGTGLNSRAQIDVVAGRTYYVRADAYGSSTGRYQLGISTLVPDDHGNDFNHATQINLSSVGNGIRTGNIEQSGDQDMIRFVATRTGRMTISQSASTGSNLDTYLYVYDANGNMIASDDDSGTGLNSRTQIDVVAGRTYYVRADAYGSSTGAYQLGFSTAVVDDHGNDFNHATRISLNSGGAGTQAGNIEQNGDQDMIRFVATQTGRMTIAQNATSGSNLDTYLYVYDANGNMIASDDDSGPGYNSLVQIDVVAGRTYYVRADAYSTSTGAYQLSFSTTGGGGGGGGSSRNLYLNFDGASLTAAQMDRYANGLDPENDGVSVNPLFGSRGDREAIIQGIIGRVQADLTAFGISVVRHHGGTVENVGATTIFIGPSTMFHPHIASDLDYGNNNPTDIAFVGQEDWGSVSSIVTALSDVVLHEAGHTYGLFHVNSSPGGTIYNETMGLRYSTPQSEWLRDTSFLNQSFAEYSNHGGGRGSQNAYQIMAANFGLSGTPVFDGEAHDLLDHLLPAYNPGLAGSDTLVVDLDYPVLTASPQTRVANIADVVFDALSASTFDGALPQGLFTTAANHSGSTAGASRAAWLNGDSSDEAAADDWDAALEAAFAQVGVMPLV